MLDRQFGINPPSLEDDEDDTPLYTSSREALGDITGKRTPSIQAPKGVQGSDPFAYLFGGEQASVPATGKSSVPAQPADPYAHLFGTVPTSSAPEKSKNVVERAAEVVDPAISRIFGDTKADESQVDKAGLARFRQEQKQKAEDVAGIRSVLGTDKERSDPRKLTESFVSGFLGSNASTAEWIGQVTGSETLKSVAGAGSKAAAAFAPEEQTFSQKVAAGFGSVAAFFVPGLGFVKAAKLLGAAKAAPAVGAGGSAVLESAAIAQETFEKAMSETGNEDLATQQAWKAAGLNLPLSFITNKIGLFGDKGGFVRRGAVAGGLESVQEGSQNVLTNVLGFKPAGEGFTESAAIGAITGGGTKMTFDAVNKYFEEASPEERKDIVDKIIEGGKETRQSVFDSLMSNDATAKILREAGISSAEDPGFVKFGAALGRFDREFAELAADPEVGPKLIANGILDPEDPRVQRVADRVLNAKQEVKGINEILEVTRSGVELTTDQKDQFNLLSAATNARELVDEITSNPELENVLKDMPGTAGFEGNRYNQIMGLWQKATLPKPAAPILVGSPTPTRTVSRETMQPVEKAPVAATGTESPGLLTSVEQINAALDKQEKDAQDSFRIAEARRQRAQQEVELSGVQPLDTQAGGRPGGIGAQQEFAYFNPVIKDGQMTSGDRVEVVSGDQILDRVTLGGLQTTPERAIFLRFLDRPGQPEFPVPVSIAQRYVQFLNRPEDPRRAQEFMGGVAPQRSDDGTISPRAFSPQSGVMTDPESTRGGPRMATDRITTDQSQQFVAADQNPPGTGVAPVRGGQTFEAEPVSEKLEAPGAARAKAASQRLSAPAEGQASTAPAASTGDVPSASQTPSQPAQTQPETQEAPGAARAKQVSKGKEAEQTVSPSDTEAKTEKTPEPKGEQESGKQTPSLKRKYLGQDVASIDELNRVIDELVKREDPNGTFKAVRVPLGDLVGKLPGVGLIEQVAKIFGKRVVFFRVTEGADFFNGTILESDDAIFVNVVTDKAHLRILGHELVHDLRKTKQKVYQQLVKALQPMLDERGFANFAELQKSEGLQTADKILEEAIGDIVGDRFGEPEFWQMMADNNPSTFKDVARAMISFIDRVLGKIGYRSLGSETLVKDLRAARSEIARILSQTVGEGVVPEGSGFSMSRKSPAADVLKAKKFKDDYDILPYTSEGQIEIPTDARFSIKREGDYGNHPVLGIPLNKNGTVSLYLPTTNEEARRVINDKKLRAEQGKSRIYLTNESSAQKIFDKPGTIEQQVGGANVLVNVDPDLVQIDAEYEDGRKDFFIPIAEGQAFFNKMRMAKLFTLNKSRKEAISPDVTIANITEGVTNAIDRWVNASAAERKAMVREAKATLKREHNMTTLLGENGKLEKTRVGEYGLTYDGKSVASLGFGMASAQKLNDKKLTTCPQSAICEALCLGETSGQNLLYGGEGSFRSGPRLSQYLKTEAFVLNPEATAILLASEISNFEKWAARDSGTETVTVPAKKRGEKPEKIKVPKQVYAAAIRLNVTSDFPPKVFEALIKAFPDVQFYDYTKLDSSPIAPNHHLTYSSTGASQVVNGKKVVNPHSNWDRMVRRLNDGFNVAMAFSSRTAMPKYIVDEKTGQRFQVWDGDKYDARFLDPKPGDPKNEFNRGMIIGLTNKDRTTAPEMAAEKNNGFFLNYDAKDGDTLVINDQEALSRGGTKVIKIPTRKTPPEGGVSVSDQPAAFSRKRSPVGFYSALAAGISEIKTNSAPASGWKDAIKGLVNKGQVKQDEVEWSGVNDWLDLQPPGANPLGPTMPKVSKEAVLEYLDGGGVKVEEVVLGAGRMPRLPDGWSLKPTDDYNGFGDAGFVVRDQSGDEMGSGATEREAMREAADPNELPGTVDTKFQKWTLPGGENYREVLLTLPRKLPPGHKVVNGFPGWQVLDDQGAIAGFGKTENEAIESFFRGEEKWSSARDYRSTHWEGIANVIAHIRMNDRTDADGKRVLFVEEIQSDWGQEGKKKGFANPKAKQRLSELASRYDALGAERRAAEKEMADLPDFNDRFAALQDRVEQISRERDSLSVQMDALRSAASGSAIPTAPFVSARQYVVYKDGKELVTKNKEGKDVRHRYDKVEAAQAAATEFDGEVRDMGPQANTEGWVNLALKKIMVMAAEGGYDRVAFINGEQSADRYDLSKRISAIAWRGGDFRAYDLNGNEEIRRTGTSQEDVADIVGKEVAEKLFSQKPEGEGRNALYTLSGEELKVGGEGMEVFYDKIVPIALKKLLPKVGGGQVGVVRFRGDDAETKYVIDAERIDADPNEEQEVIVRDRETLEGVAPPFNSLAEAEAWFDKNDVMVGVGNQPGFDVTDAMRQRAEEGLPMFSRKRDPHKEAERQKLNEGPSWFQNLPPEAQEALRKVGAVPAKLTFRDRVDALKENLASRAVQGIFDPYAPISKLDDTAYMQARMSTNVTGAFGHIVTDGEVKWEGDWLAPVKGTKGMLDILKQLPEGEIDRFMWWIAANRAEKLTREEREFLFSGRDIAALRRLNMPNMGTKMPTRPVVYAKVLGQLNKLNKSVLDVAKQSGLINQEQYNRFAADAFYVPFYRVMEDGDVGGPATAAGLVGQQFSKRLKGGKEQLNDLLANYMNNWEHIVHASAKNMAGRSTLDAAVDAGIATEVKGDPPKGSVKVMVDGKPKHYMVSDPLVLDAISSLYAPALQGGFVKIGSMFKRLFTRTVTVSPTFKFYNNLIRDAITSQAISPELSNNPIANTYRGVKLMSKDNPLYNSMLVGGGLFKYSTWDEGDRHEYVKRLIDQGVDPQTILNTPEKIKSFLSGAFQRYMEFGDKVENAQRAAIYDAAIKAGKSQLEASFAARQVIDFSLTGRWSAIRTLAAVLPFFNARLQGMYSLGKLGVAPTIRAAKQGKDASASDRQRAARFAAVTAAVTAATIALYLANNDDEDFKRREDWDRDSFWWIKINGVAWRIPKPFEIGAFATIVERGLEQIVDESVEGKVFGKRLYSIVMDQLSMNPVPQLVRPAFDVYANKDGFRETDIESPGMRRLPIEDRVGQNTSYAARAMGAVSKEFADILEPMIGKESADKVQFSPVQIDYLIKGYLGWVGTQALMLSDAAVRGVAGIESPTPRFQEQIPVRMTLGNTIQELPTRNSRYVGDFYRQAREINEIMQAIREYERARDFDKARELREKEGEKVELSGLYSRTQRRMSEINKELRRIRDDAEMTADEKRARIDQLEEIREEYAKSAEDSRKARR